MPRKKAETKPVEPVVNDLPSEEEIFDIRENECPNCHEINWGDVVVGIDVIPGQHKCMSCGHVITEKE